MAVSQKHFIRLKWDDKASQFKNETTTELPKSIVRIQNTIISTGFMKKPGNILPFLLTTIFLLIFSIGSFYLEQSNHDIMARVLLGVCPFLSFIVYVWLHKTTNRLNSIHRYIESNKSTLDLLLIEDGFSLEAFFVKGNFRLTR